MTEQLRNRKYFIRTFGCQMNESDSERIAGVLASLGADPASSEEDGDVIIVNTCAVRGKSQDKLYSYLGRLQGLKRKRPLLIGVAGCVAQIERDRLLEGRPFVDFVVGPDAYLRLPEILDRCREKKIVLTERSAAWQEAPPGLRIRPSPVSATVTIMEGCDNFCSYCIVPWARGREKFRPLSSVRAEIEDLARRGYKEIQFLGQNVNTYRDPDGGASFPALLRETARTEGIERVRFLTSHPKNFTPELVDVMASSPRICRQLHLPLQSGSTSVLRRMKRGYSRREYMEKIFWLRKRMPGIDLSTDIIVGFPGETEEEFRETLSALDEVRFANIFSFRFSPRPGTEAARGPDDVPLETKKSRLIEVQSCQKKIQSEYHHSLIGRTLKVLVGGPGKKDPTAFFGRSEGYQVVNFRSEEDRRGQFVEVDITTAGPYSLRGKIAGA